MTDSNKKFIVYKASAGSGKTYTLVKEYLKLVLPNPDKYRRILAVTFTNKAAYEMKSRVIEYLQVLSNMLLDEDGKANSKINSKYIPLINSLVKDTQLNEKQLKERASVVIEKILHNYSDFAICTIDSFVQRIIRTFAFDMKIPHNFEVELDSGKILSQAVDLVLSYAGINNQITEVLVDFVKQKISEDKSWDIEHDLKDFAKELLKENTSKYISLFHNFTLADFKIIYKKYFSAAKLQNDEATTIATSVISTVEAKGLGCSVFYQSNKGIHYFFSSVMRGGLSNASSNSYCTKTIEEGKWYSGSASPGNKQAIDTLKPFMAESYNKIISLQNSHRDLMIINKALFPLSLLNLIKEEMEGLKTESNLIFINDFYSMINAQLLNEPVPFIYQRTGEKFEHFFIDEFQDTSILQFQNMLPLIDNSMASGNFNFIVGDGKQAIYRWRNGEVRQFSNLPDVFQKPDTQHFDEFEKSLNRNFSTYQEYNPETRLVNYRSRKQIVDFNNELFEFLNARVQHNDYKKIYQDLTQLSKPGSEGGYVNINLLADDDEYRDNQLNAVLNIVHDLIAEQIPLKDIAVICRKNNEASAAAVHLLSNSIDVVSSESLMLQSSAKVNFIVSLLRVMQNPNDHLSVATVLIYFHQRFVKDMALHDFLEMYRKASHEKYILYAIEEMFLMYHVSIDFRVLFSFSLFDLNEELLRIFHLNRRTDSFLIFYLETVNEFMKSRSADISGFLEWWDEYGIRKSITVPDELNAVKVMTIHKAKGQEFPVVIYPFANENDKMNPNNLVWAPLPDPAASDIPAVPVKLNKELLDSLSFEYLYAEEKAKVILDMLNLCYVALTRAEDRLYIISKNKTYKETTTFGGLLIEFLKQKQIWAESNSIYEFGEIPLLKMDESEALKEDNKNISFPVLISGNWFKRVFIKPESIKVWDNTPNDNNLAWGNMIHTVLSEMKSGNDLTSAINNQISQGLLLVEDAEKVISYISNMLSMDNINAFFKPEQNSATEIEIITPENKVYRPDRIIFGTDNNIIIDFKTGKEENKHQDQVRNYGKLIADISGKESLQYLIYLHEQPKLVVVK